MGKLICGQDPLPYAARVATLKSHTRHVVGGIASQAIGALENALLDVCGKAYGVPVCALFGGPYRTELPVYWCSQHVCHLCGVNSVTRSHCGSFRIAHSGLLHNPLTKQPTPPLRSLADLRALGQGDSPLVEAVVRS